MFEVRRRVYQQSHVRLDVRSKAKFVAGLVRAGLLKEE